MRAHNLADLRAASADAVRALQDSFGNDPRAFLASVMNRKNLPIERRMRAAEALLPFCYPKLSATAVVTQKLNEHDPEAVIRLLNDRLSKLRQATPLIEAEPEKEAA